MKIPEYLVCEIAAIRIGQSIHVSELTLPEGAVAVTPGSVVIVQVVAAAGEAAADGADGSAEPELIRKEKAADAAS